MGGRWPFITFFLLDQRVSTAGPLQYHNGRRQVSDPSEGLPPGKTSPLHMGMVHLDHVYRRHFSPFVSNSAPLSRSHHHRNDSIHPRPGPFHRYNSPHNSPLHPTSREIHALMASPNRVSLHPYLLAHHCHSQFEHATVRRAFVRRLASCSPPRRLLDLLSLHIRLCHPSISPAIHGQTTHHPIHDTGLASAHLSAHALRHSCFRDSR